MYVEQISSTTIGAVEYELTWNDPTRPSEHWGVRATRRDTEATSGGYAGIIIASLAFESYDRAKATYDAFLAVATHAEWRMMQSCR